VSFNFMAAVTICSDFGASKNKVFELNMINEIFFAYAKKPLNIQFSMPAERAGMEKIHL